MTMGKVIFIGAGPGAADLITLRGARLLAHAEPRSALGLSRFARWASLQQVAPQAVDLARDEEVPSIEIRLRRGTRRKDWELVANIVLARRKQPRTTPSPPSTRETT